MAAWMAAPWVTSSWSLVATRLWYAIWSAAINESAFLPAP